ncbi:hypothetical protein DLAC_01008 [Tieghemostelium lacteum]|uniref:Uncharacterized protein n=1 Tax=Tieghemostelium lacteum TaxID=361077 RepID=A0A152A7T9_TIELA|nr:hypothetical protein DLAC_01008 [Tieghemostelium lacteum]|eukprot:KYR02191.1 hypothetical protein DLAC_01008 [Tieghemostelium lacteum]
MIFKALSNMGNVTPNSLMKGHVNGYSDDGFVPNSDIQLAKRGGGRKGGGRNRGNDVDIDVDIDVDNR